MTPRLACVLRSGGDFGPEHVEALVESVAPRWPDGRPEVLCLSDMSVPSLRVTPLQHDWPGWWAKLEIFREDIEGPLLYMDLDTRAVGDLAYVISIGQLGRGVILRDFYRQGDAMQSAVMYLPEPLRRRTWDAWMRADRSWHVGKGKIWSDQNFLERAWHGENIARWQDVLPGQIVSYKVDKVAEDGVPKDARLVAFHGRPRPWEVGW